MRRRTIGILALALAASSATGVFAQEAAPAAAPAPAQTTVTLESGDVLKGTIKSCDKESVLLVHPVLGEVRLPRTKVSHAEPELPPPPPPPPAVVEVTSTDRDKAAAAAALAAAAPQPAPAPPVAPGKPSLWTGLTREDEKSFFDGWKRTAELGMNMTSGNNDSFSSRASVSLRRGTKKMSTAVDSSYNYSRNNSGETRNRGEVRARNDFGLGDTDWQLWGAGAVEFDKYTPWEARVSLSTGPAYTIIKNEKTTLVCRVGLGGYRDIDGTNNDIVANGVASFDLSQKLFEGASMYANGEVIPDLDDIQSMRTIARAGVSFMLDPETNTTLRLGAEHRFTTESGPRDASDVDMFVTLGFSF